MLVIICTLVTMEIKQYSQGSKSHHCVWPCVSCSAELARSLIGDVIIRTGYMGAQLADKY